MHGTKSLLGKPHVALGTNFIDLKSHDSATTSLQSTFMCTKMQIYLFWAFFGTLRIIILGKGHARAQIIACLASRGTRDKLHHFEITRHRDRITLINIYVFKNCKYTCFWPFLAPSGLLSWVKGMHGHKSLLA